MEFVKLKKSHRAKIYELYAKQKTLGSEYSLVTLFQWHKKFDVEAAAGEDYMCFRLFYKGKLLYFPPLTPSRKRCSELMDELVEMGAKDFAEITDYNLPEFCKRNFNIEPDRDMSEYIYSAKSFISLAGKALHSKRNHISQFVSAYQYTFADYKEEHKDSIVQLLDKWVAEKLAYYDTMLDQAAPTQDTAAQTAAQSQDIAAQKEVFVAESTEERGNILNILDDLNFYNCFADVLIVDDKVIGLSIGEILPTSVGVVFFEKADTAYNGAYTMLSNLFAAKRFANVSYINRQEDMGDEGLRRAKLSYKPKQIFMKYVASSKKDNPYYFSSDVIDLYKASFPEDDQKTVDYFFNNIFNPKNMKNIRIGDQLVSALHIVPKSLNYMGYDIKLPFLVAVATDTRYKNKGYARRLIEETLRCVKSQKMPFVALYPAIKGFYERFGFQQVFCQSKLGDLLPSDNLTKAATSDFQQLKNILDAKTADYQVKITRDLPEVKLKCCAEDNANLLYINGSLAGYEFATASGDAVETCILPQYSSYEQLAAPVGMARIVDLDAAFALLDLKNKYKFKLTDCFYEENNNVYEVFANTIKVDVGFDFTLTERQLCELFFGLEPEGVPKQFVEEFPKAIFMPDKY